MSSQRKIKSIEELRKLAQEECKEWTIEQFKEPCQRLITEGHVYVPTGQIELAISTLENAKGLYINGRIKELQLQDLKDLNVNLTNENGKHSDVRIEVKEDSNEPTKELRDMMPIVLKLLGDKNNSNYFANVILDQNLLGLNDNDSDTSGIPTPSKRFRKDNTSIKYDSNSLVKYLCLYMTCMSVPF